MIVAYNILNKAPTLFTNYSFVSAVESEEVTFLASGSGLFRAEGSSDNGAAIQATVSTPEMKLNGGKEFRARSVVCAGEYGDMDMTFSFDGEESYTTTLNPASGKAQGQRIGRGKYLQLTIENQDGADFLIDRIDAVLVAHRY